MKLSGIFAEITTPFDHNGDIYRSKIEHNLSRWNATSLAGYMVGSGAGERDLLAHDERMVVFELSARYAAEGRTLIADVSAGGVREAADLARQAARLGYHAVYADRPQHGSEDLFFRALADRSPVPLIAGGGCMQLANVAQHPNIAGAVTGQTGAPREGFQMLAGDASELWKSLKDGASGAILPFAAASPYAAIAIWEAFRTREEEAGEDWQRRIVEPSVLISGNRYGVPGLKYAMDLNGYYGGPARLPYAPLTREGRGEMEQAFREFSGKT